MDPYLIGCVNYVILDCTSRNDISQGCQDEYMTIPSGCAIAPRTDENIAMIAQYYWGTHGICLADGTCWWGLHGGAGAGTQDCSHGANGFQTTTIDGEVAYKPPCCSERILLACTNSCYRRHLHHHRQTRLCHLPLLHRHRRRNWCSMTTTTPRDSRASSWLLWRRFSTCCK